jgi:hypothetical protein
MAGLLSTTTNTGLLPPPPSPNPLNLSQQIFSSGTSGSTPMTSSPSSGGFSLTPQQFLQAIPRAAVQVLDTIGTAVPFVGRTPAPYTPTGPAAQAVFGKEPIQSLQQSTLDTKAQYPSLPLPAIAFGLSAFSVLDLTPLGGEKTVIKSLANSRDIVEVAQILRKVGVQDDLVGDYAKLFANTSDPKLIEQGLQSIDNLQKVATPGLLKTVPKSTPLKAPPALGEKIANTSPSPQTIVPQTNGIIPRPTLKVSSYVDDVSKIVNGELNVGRLKITPEAAGIVTRVVDEVKPAIERAVGMKLSNDEAIRAATVYSKTLTKAVGRDDTLEWQAAMLRARQQLAAASESGTVDENYIKNLLTIKTQGTDIARKLQSLSISADPVEMTNKEAILAAVLKVNQNIEDILKAAEGVDFHDFNQATNFYRTFVKPTAGEWIDLIRYNSMLSSPKTHIVNIFSNLLNSSLIAPFEKALTGGLDFLGSKITGRARSAFTGESGAYMANYFKNVRLAAFRFAEVLKGNRAYTNLDTRNIPIATKGVKGRAVAALSIPTRLLEGMDQFFMTLATDAETGALRYRAQKLGGGENLENLRAELSVVQDTLENSPAQGLRKYYGNHDPEYENLDEIYTRNVGKSKAGELDAIVQEHGFNDVQEAHEAVLQDIALKKRAQELESAIKKTASQANVGNIETLAKAGAEYRLFRQKPNADGQGKVLDAVDQFTVMLQGLRHSKNPLVALVTKFTVPFIQTPMNIFKQGIEYSPAGLTTLWGAANKTEQLSKAIIGSAIFSGAGVMLASDRLTWGEPTDPTLKAAFKAAGKQSYSVKIGNTWYSYQKLPPGVAFPFAMVAALHDVQENRKVDDDTVDLVLSSVAKYGEFLADQSYAKSIGDILSAAKGGEAGIARIISNDLQQLVPYRALGGWLARLSDESQRKVDSKASFIDQQVQLLMMNIPGLSQKTPAREDSSGAPIPNQNRFLNSVSPIQFTKETDKAADYQGMLDVKKLNRATTAASDKAKEEVEREWATIRQMPSSDARKDYMRTIAAEDPTLAKKLIAKAKEESLKRSSLDEKLANAPVATRAQYIFDALQKEDSPEDKKALLREYAAKKILTEDTLVALAKLLKK